MALIEFFKRKGQSGFGYGSTAEEVTRKLDLKDFTYLLTGCNSGLGLETLKTLCMRGANVLACARTIDKANYVCSRISTRAIPLSCDLSEPESINKAIIRIKSMGLLLDGIIANAAIMALPKLQKKFGYELQFFNNHVGHFILITGLISSLKSNGRIVMLSSLSHKKSYKEGIQFDNLSGDKEYSPWLAYGQSKLCNILFSNHLASHILSKNQTSNSLHPGMIPTNLNRHLHPIRVAAFRCAKPLILKTIPQGASTQCYVATKPELSNVSGSYFVDCNIAKPSKYAEDSSLALRLWEHTKEIIRYLNKV